jgi:hypothetical protein
MLLYKKVKGEWDRSLGSQRMKQIKMTKGAKSKQNNKAVVTKTATVSQPANADDSEDDE